MTKKIFANFNLNQSLSSFQIKITELLKLNNVNQWNGITLKDKEEKIREAALILAGQCIGILLNNLSKSREASQTTINQTKGWCSIQKLKKMALKPGKS